MRIATGMRREAGKNPLVSVRKVVATLTSACVLCTACGVAFVDYDDPKNEDPVWSPNGQYIAFVSYDVSSSSAYYEGPLLGPYDRPDAFNWTEISVMNAKGSERRLVTQNTVPDLDPDWSPDGDKLVFVSRRDALPHQGAFSGEARVNSDIFVVDLSNGRQTNLTAHLAKDEYARWSPDGQLIAFISNRDGSDNGDIFTMKPDGTAITRQTSLGWVSGLDWSPDAKQLLFYSRSDGDWEIYRLTLEDNQLTRVTDNLVEDTQPAWSPTLESMVFTSDRHGNNQVYVLNFKTGAVRQVSLGTDSSWGADWSPDGRFISFVAREGANVQLRIWDSAENKAIVASDHVSSGGHPPRWSPDGQFLVFTRDEDLNADGFPEEKIWIVRGDGTGERRLSPVHVNE